MSSSDCSYFIVPSSAFFVFHSRNSVSELTGAILPRDSSQALKSRFIPYLNTIEQSSSLPRVLSSPAQILHRKRLRSGSGSRTVGKFAGSITVAPLSSRIAIASSNSSNCEELIPPRGFSVPTTVLGSTKPARGIPMRAPRRLSASRNVV